MFEPIKVALGEYLQGFYKQLTPTTPALKEFKDRGFSYCFGFAPSRMVDHAAEMLATWQRNDTNNSPTRPAKLPVVIVAVAQDYTPTGRDYSYQVTDPIEVVIPSDAHNRYFELKTVVGDIRVQFAICATDEATAKSIAAQFLLYVDSPTRRGFDATYSFAKNDLKFPCQIETPDSPASSVETGVKNVCMLALDLNLHCTVPIYDAPTEFEPNDGTTLVDDAGNTIPYDSKNPSGYPVVHKINVDGNLSEPVDTLDIVISDETNKD